MCARFVKWVGHAILHLVARTKSLITCALRAQRRGVWHERAPLRKQPATGMDPGRTRSVLGPHGYYAKSLFDAYGFVAQSTMVVAIRNPV